MNVFSRGVRNAFRNVTRTFSLVLILGLSIGLCLAMLVAHQAVGKKITTVEGSVGNTITIAPAGFQQGAESNNALSTSQLANLKGMAHVSGITETLNDRLSTTGATNSFPNFGGKNTSNATTSLKSPTTLRANGPRFLAGGFGGGAAGISFSFPVSFLGTNNPGDVNGSQITLSSGSAINGEADADKALISKAMATKNGLSVGSTFTAYNATLTVTGIFNSSTQNDANTVVLSLPTMQRLTGQSGVVTSAVVTVDSLTNLNSVTNRVKNALASSADVTSAVQQAQQTVSPLKNIQTISLYSLIGAVIAGAIIILLTMIMIVRERRREIGVLKAIGGSNVKVALQFMAEAVTLTLMGAVVGIILGVIAGSPITKMLVSDNTASAATTGFGGARFGEGGGAAPGGFGGGRFVRGGGLHANIANIHAAVGWSIILYGLAAALVIAVAGSALASFFIAKIRPAEVMRVE